MIGIIAFLIVWIVVTLVGHASWVIIGAILKGIFSGLRDESEAKLRERAIASTVLSRLRSAGRITDQEWRSLQTKIQALDRPLSEPMPHTYTPLAASEVVTQEPVVAEAPDLVEELVFTGQLVQPDESTIGDTNPFIVQPASLQPERSVTPDVPTLQVNKQPWSEVIQSFLAVHNIRWGELVAGILIVFCSVGLVISLWNTIIQIHPIVPAIIFLTANAAVFGVGFYTLSKWKLRHSSRAVLYIASMLVPLSVVAGLATANQGENLVKLTEPMTIAVIFFGGLLDTYLLYAAGKTLLHRHGGGPFALAVAAPATCLPMIPASLRLWHEGAAGTVMLVGLFFSGAIAWFSSGWRRQSLVSTGELTIQRKVLPAMARRWWILYSVAVFAFGVFAINVAYLGRAWGHGIWMWIALGTIPVLTTIAVSCRTWIQHSMNASHRLTGNVVMTVCLGACAMVLPHFCHRPLHLGSWAIVFSASVAVLGAFYRRSSWTVAATVPVSVAGVLLSSWFRPNVTWETMPWSNRLVGGEPMMATLCLSIAMFAILRWIASVTARQLAQRIGIVWLGTTAAQSAMLSFAPESWLGIAPVWLPIVVLSFVAIGLRRLGGSMSAVHFVNAAQCVWAGVGAAIAWRYFHDSCYEFDSVRVVWYWGFASLVLGIVWEGTRVSFEKVPIADPTRIDAPSVRWSTVNWFHVVGFALVMVGMLLDIVPLLTDRSTQRAALDVAFQSGRRWFPYVTLLAGWIGTWLSLRPVNEDSRKTDLEVCAFLSFLSGPWIATQLVSMLDFSNSVRLIVVSTLVLGITFTAWYYRQRLFTRVVEVAQHGGAIWMAAASLSLLYFDWLSPLWRGEAVGTVATAALATWWLLSSGWLGLNRERGSNEAARSLLSWILFASAAVVAVPVFSDLAPIVWSQYAALASLVWALATNYWNRLQSTVSEAEGNRLANANVSAIPYSLVTGTGVGLLTGLVALATVVTGLTLWDPLTGMPGAILLAVSIIVLSGVGIKRGWNPIETSWITWPESLCLVSGMAVLLVQRANWLSLAESVTVQFGLLSVASAGALYQFRRTGAMRHCILIGSIATFAVVSDIVWGGVRSDLQLALLTMAGLAVMQTRSCGHDAVGRFALWMVMAFGSWSFVLWARTWGYTGSNSALVVVWCGVWIGLVSIVGRLRQTTETQSCDLWAQPLMLEWLGLTGFVTVVEWLHQAVDVQSVWFGNREVASFALRGVTLVLLAGIWWWRSEQRWQLSCALTSLVAWLFLTLSLGFAEYGMKRELVLTAVPLVTALCCGALTYGTSGLARLHQRVTLMSKHTASLTPRDHAIATLIPHAAVTSATVWNIIWMLQDIGPGKWVSLAICAVALGALGAFEVAERVPQRRYQRVTFLWWWLAIALWVSTGITSNQNSWLLATMKLLMIAVWLVPGIRLLLPKLLGSQWQSRWSETITESVRFSGAIAVGSLALMIVQEINHRLFVGRIDGVPIATVIAVGLTIAILSGISAVLAIASGPVHAAGRLASTPWRRPLEDRQRKWLVVLAQGLFVIAWMHVLLCRPSLARFGLRAYWPYIVLVISFISVGAVEWARRRRDDVITHTLQQTSLYLPLIPVLGLLMIGGWSAPFSGISSSGTMLSLVLIVGTLYYLFLSRLWDGLSPRVLALVLANLSVWSLLAKEPDWSFLSHPQMWLIPPALCVLGLAQRYRKEWNAQSLSVVRYGAMLVIYIGSTADMFIQHVGSSMWGPVVLVLLALAGMLAGVLLQVRPFLYLGTLFVLLGVTSMVWHAQRSLGQVWPWWLFGITLGACLLAALMSIEKNKGKLQSLSARLARWES